MSEPSQPKRTRRKLSRRKKAVFAFVAVCFGLLLTEGTLHLMCLAFPQVRYAISDDRPSPFVDDPVLGVRPSPEVSDHDSAGWRNERRLEQADIVCIGDSQTYGTSCRREEAWPQVLGRKVGVSSYNMGYGSYGPTHHLSLTPEALELKPRLVLYAIYSGNDLADCYRMVYYAERGQMPELRSTDAGTLAAIERAEKEQGLIGGWKELQSIVDPPSNKEPSWRSRLSSWFRLYGVVRSIRKKIDEDDELAKDNDPQHIDKKWQARKKTALEAGDSNALFVFESGSVRTFLTPRTRAEIADLEDARIAEGMRLAQVALERSLQLTDGKSQVAIVLIPTKELVFCDAVRKAYGDPPPTLEKLERAETAFWQQMKDFLDRRGVAWIDTLPALRDCVARGVNPYRESWDGHPNAAGNEAMAEAIAGAAPLRALREGN